MAPSERFQMFVYLLCHNCKVVYISCAAVSGLQISNVVMTSNRREEKVHGPRGVFS